MNYVGRLVRRIAESKWGIRVIRTWPKSQGSEGIRRLGHRAYVGGLWDRMGELQFEFLVGEGLEPHHYLLDIGCGSLRAGVHFIPYLEAGHYLGIEKEEELIRAGIEKELGMELYKLKKPHFVVSDVFEFEKFPVRPHYAIAQSLFTHLPMSLIDTCFRKLRGFIRDDGVFYTTYFEAQTEVSNPSEPHDHDVFFYTQQQMESFGARNGWLAEYIGDWGHPRGQVMVRYRPT